MPRPPVRAQRPGRPSTANRSRSPRGAGRRRQHAHAPQPSSNNINNNARDQLARKLSNKPIGARPEDSDDSDRLVTKGPGGRRGRSNLIQQVYVSGAVGPGDTPGAHPTRAQRMKAMADALKSPRPGSISAPSPAVQAPVDRAVDPSVSHSPVPIPLPAPTTTTKTTKTTSNGLSMNARDTPARDVSILDGFKSRKRQLSVLHLASLDSSSLALGNDSFALPDDESTPAQIPAKQQQPLPNITPLPLSSSNSASRKRKLGFIESVSASHHAATPSLASDTTASGQKRRRRTLRAEKVDDDDDDQDIMAPPMSSSSSSGSRSGSPPVLSPIRPVSKSKCLRKNPQPPASRNTRAQTATAATTAKATSAAAPRITTQQLQSLMPSKRHRIQSTWANTSEFDIPSDPSSDPVCEPDESFLPPTKRRGKQSKSTMPKPKAKAKAKAKAKTEMETERDSALQPSHASRTNMKSTTSSSTPQQKQLQQQRGPFLGGRKRSGAASSSEPALASSFEEKEDAAAATATAAKAGQSGGSLLGSCVDQDNSKTNNHNHAVTGTENSPLEPPVLNTKFKSKWDEIDAFDLQFEDVSVYDRSSEGDAR